MSRRKNPLDYWALEDDPDTLSEECLDRVKKFYDSVRASHHFATIARNWLYYHGMFFENDVPFDWTAVREITDDLLAAGVNHFRNLIDHIYTFVCQQRLSFEVRAKQNDARSFEQAKIGQHVVEHYRREKYLEESLKRCVKHALVLNSGYIHHPWDIFGGDQQAVPNLERSNITIDELGQINLDSIEWDIVPQGDFRFTNPTVWDIVFDPRVREWSENQWLLVRTFENRYELAARTEDPDTRDAILDMDSDGAREDDLLFDFGFFQMFGDVNADMSDSISVWNFYHRQSYAVPDGVKFRFIGDSIPLGPPEPLGFERIPVTRVQPGETLMTQLGYSPANDMQAPQELLNSEVSIIATNHHGAGFSAIWVPDGSELETEDMGDGVFVVRGGQIPPRGVSFQANSPDHEKFSNFCMKTMEYLSGINAVARGQPEANLKSGEALKVMDAKAAQFASPLKESYAHALEQVGTFILRTARDYMTDDEERVVSIAGERNRSRIATFKKEDLRGVDRVIVDIASPTTDTLAGKMWMAEQLLERGMITVPQEFITVARTGQLDPLLQADEAQLERIHAENERLSEGQLAQIDEFTDNHALDIREHAALMSSPATRENPPVASAVYAHIIGHFQALMKPEVQWAMAALGFPTVPPPMAGAPPTPPAQGRVPGRTAPPGGEKPRQIQVPGEPPRGGPGGGMAPVAPVTPGAM